MMTKIGNWEFVMRPADEMQDWLNDLDQAADEMRETAERLRRRWATGEIADIEDVIELLHRTAQKMSPDLDEQ